MIIGCPKEIKTLENRVGITPSGVFQLVQDGHKVMVQSRAGEGSGFSNQEYLKAGASLETTAEAIYNQAELIVKVKEPLKEEYSLIKENQIVFTYFHFASSQELINGMIASKSICIAYETIRDRDGKLPLLIPMSQIAGRLSVLEGMRFLTKPYGGKGILPGGIPGVAPAKITIIGGGVVGTEAAKVAAGIGADVTILDINATRLLELSETLPANVTTLFSNKMNLSKLVKETDLLVGAVLVPGAKAPKLVSEELVMTMKGKSVIVDVAIDQGGCIVTSEKTNFESPTIEKHDVIHYGVTNMPGAVAQTATLALTQVTLPYVQRIANNGWESLKNSDKGFAKGVSIVNGKVVSDEF